MIAATQEAEAGESQVQGLLEQQSDNKASLGDGVRPGSKLRVKRSEEICHSCRAGTYHMQSLCSVSPLYKRKERKNFQVPRVVHGTYWGYNMSRFCSFFPFLINQYTSLSEMRDSWSHDFEDRILTKHCSIPRSVQLSAQHTAGALLNVSE